MSLLFVVYLVDSMGNIYEIKLLENAVEHCGVLGASSNEDDGRHTNVIYRGVNRVGGKI